MNTVLPATRAFGPDLLRGACHVTIKKCQILDWKAVVCFSCVCQLLLRRDQISEQKITSRREVGRPTDGVRELVQDRGLDQGCFAVCWGMSRVETAGGLQGAQRGDGAHWIGLLSGFGVRRQF